MTKNGISLISVLEKRHIHIHTSQDRAECIESNIHAFDVYDVYVAFHTKKIPTRGGNKQLNYSPQQEKTHSRCMYESFRFRTMIAV